MLAFLRALRATSAILVVANLSRFAQYVELDLSEFRGPRARRALRPAPSSRAIGELPYLLTLGPHGFYWFSLEADRARGRVRARRRRAATSRSSWHRGTRLLDGAGAERLDAVAAARACAAALVRREGRRSARSASRTSIPCRGTERAVAGCVGARRTSTTPRASPRPTSLPLAGQRRAASRAIEPRSDRGRQAATAGRRAGVLFDALARRGVRRRARSRLIARRRAAAAAERAPARRHPTERFARLRGHGPLEPRSAAGEQSNTSVVFGDQLC